MKWDKEEEQHLLDSIRLIIIQWLKDERDISDKRYAMKLVEGIVFALVGLLCLGVIGALINLVITR